MPPKRKVTRPRLAFNCLECGRQKRRCDKLKPKCTNCQRLDKTCIYNTGTRDPETGRVSRPKVSEEPVSSVSRGSIAIINNDDLPSHDEDRHDYMGTLPPRFFSGSRIGRGARERYIGLGFWAYLRDHNIPGQPSIYQNLYYGEPDDGPSLPASYVSSIRLAELLTQKPTKPVCDALLQSFLLRVHYPFALIDLPDFLSQYELFWNFLDTNQIGLPTNILEDPTYICLFWAILYAGASVLTHVDWISLPLKYLDQRQTIDQLGLACSESLTACRHTDHPTIQSLTASILSFHFDGREGLSKDLFISASLRLAQSMGLHYDSVHPGPDPRSAEHRKFLWWHLVWLDVQTTIATGLPTCCSNDMVQAYQMISEFKQASSEISTPEISVVKLCAIGRFQMAKLHHQLFGFTQNLKEPELKDITQLIKSMKDFHGEMDSLIAKLPEQGIPEKGMMPPNLKNASPQSSPALYEDSCNEPTVLGACTRIILAMYKLESMIMLQQALLPRLNTTTTAPSHSWKRITRLCLRYLQYYLQVCRTPAFNPYSWFWPFYHMPRRCIILILHYLEFARCDVKDRRDMLLCVDEFIKYGCSIPFLRPLHSESTSHSMDFLIKLRQQLSMVGEDDKSKIDINLSDHVPVSGSASVPKHVDYLEELFDGEFWASLA
ncbi:hypothetical protein PENSTE_c003G04257 [Penicillium steckii]|uniref:Zn(2)-C6 fungal-type domain-containing protein n=1 Tax=Penicillium steckii TaxID=303698 RepID=A0A1V6TQD2_9EURO|nr:hypothetical protein PENSTE_c003G04257 [Penicillium steckii]